MVSKATDTERKQIVKRKEDVEEVFCFKTMAVALLLTDHTFSSMSNTL